MQLQPRAEIAPTCAYPIVQYVKAKLLSAVVCVLNVFFEIVLCVFFLKYSNELVQSGEGVLVYEARVSGSQFLCTVRFPNQISMRNIGLSVTLTFVSKSISFPSFCRGFHRFHVIYKTSVYRNASSALTDSVANTDGLKAV